MRKPTVHLNGTSREALLRQYEDAAQAVEVAFEKLRIAAPHARDYYTQGPDAFTEAVSEYKSREDRLRSVYNELLDLYEAVSDQG